MKAAVNGLGLLELNGQNKEKNLKLRSTHIWDAEVCRKSGKKLEKGSDDFEINPRHRITNTYDSQLWARVSLALVRFILN